MKKLILISALICLMTHLAGQTLEEVVAEFSKYTAVEKPKVMLIGSFHFNEYKGDNSGNTHTGNPPDVLTEKRQKELDELVKLIASFKPTKVCVEAKTNQEEKLNDQYHAYVKGEHDLHRNERQQVIFRLAAEANINKVNAIDANGEWYMDSVATYAIQNGQAESIMKANQIIPSYLQQQYDSMDGMHMAEIFHKINSPEQIHFIHAFHLEMTAIGKDDNYIGTGLYADWMIRNMKIFTNIQRLAEKNDRIVVLFGAAHIHSLKQMIEDSFNLEYVSVQDFLGQEK